MKIKALLLLLLLAGICGRGQERTADSLLQELKAARTINDSSRIILGLASLYGVDSKKGLLWYKKGASLAYRNNADPSAFTDAIGIHHLNRQEYDVALSYFLKAAKKASQFGNREREAAIYDHISIIFDEQEQLPEALAYLRKSIKINHELKDSDKIADNYMSFGIITAKMDNPAGARAYFDKALELYKNEAHPGKLAYAYFNIGDITQQLPLRYSYLLRAHELWQQYDPEFSIAVSTLSNLAETCLLLSRSPALSREAGSTPEEMLAKAEGYITTAAGYAEKYDGLYNLIYIYQVMAMVHEDKGELNRALHYTRLHHKLQDSVFSQENKNRIAAVESEREITRRDKEIEVNRLTLEARDKQLWYLFAGILLITAVVALVFLQSHTRKQNNLRLQQLNEDLDKANKVKAKLFGILNHDLRGPVASLINLLHLRREAVLSPEKEKELEEKTTASAENLLEAMEDLLLWSKGQMENFGVTLKPVPAQKLFDDIQSLYGAATAATLTFLNPQNVTFTTDEDYLKTILRNLTANALKALDGKPGGTITWSAYEEGGHRWLAITDNGQGGNAETFGALHDDTKAVGIKNGLGLHLIRDLAKAIGCEITVDTTPGSGTTITLRVN